LLTACLCSVSIGAAQTRSDFAVRSDYLQAREYLRQGASADFRRMANSLRSYALYPYLQYYELRGRLSRASDREVKTFLENYPDLAVTSLTRKRWLRELGKRKKWRTFLSHYVVTSDAELQCFQLRALYATGQTEVALDQTTSLWIKPRSQPAACDPLFETWRKTSRFTQDIVWQRFSAAIEGNSRSLARYLMRYFGERNRALADTYYNVHSNPQRIGRSKDFSSNALRVQKIIAHGLTRLAARDANEAAKLWQRYQRSHTFDPLTRQRVAGSVAVALARQEEQFPAPANRASFTLTDVIEDLADAAVKAQQWHEVTYWVTRLPADLQQKSQWVYWYAQANKRSATPTSLDNTALISLAGQRHYYGFLAAQELGLPGQMNAADQYVSSVALARVRRHPGIMRSVELTAVGDDLNGRREWFNALNTMTASEQIVAAELAAQLGLINLAISTANIADANDHLHLRFPLAYEAQFRQASLRTGLPVPLLISIARQESAMQADVRSSADARGLMQLLPSTARIVARRARLTQPSASDLADPNINIRLGSYHLAWLIERYQGQTPLAIAAYNAGEHRVDRWISESSDMPMDVWIERIPFRETRNYVKNVLAFRHVYGTKLNTPTPTLGVHEQRLATR
jgi:soluble lytic murein transglycosylase